MSDLSSASNTEALPTAAELAAGSTSASRSAIGGGAKWLVLAAAFLGWMFDGLEMGIFPQIARPAMSELLHGKLDHLGWWNNFIAAMFLWGAAVGGLFFGWLGDKIGRVKAMSAS